VAIWPIRPDEGSRGFVDVIDTTKLERVRVIETRGGMHDTWMAPDGKTFLAMSPEAKFMTLYDTKTEKPLWTCCQDGSIGTMVMEAGPDGSTSRAFFSYQGNPEIVVLDFKQRKEVARIPFPTDTDGPFAGVQPTGDFHGNEISPDGKNLWVISRNIVYRYSLPDLKHLGHIHLAEVDQTGQPYKVSGVEGTWLVLSPDGQKVYAARPARNLVSVIDVKTMKEEAQVPVGEYPLHITMLPLK
jgi:YVTN family beta-propeller protein